MAITGLQVINIGLQNESANSDSLYTAFNKTKTNFATLFACSSPYNTFTANTGITVNANTTTGTVDITNTGVLNIIPGTGVSINQSNGNVTISAIGGGNGGSGTVTSVGITPVSSQRLVVTNSPIVSSGNISLDLAQTGVSGGTYTNPTVGVDVFGRVVSIANGNASGTVTSVGITSGTGIQVSGGPITTSGNIIIQNTGVTRLNAGTGINLSGSNGNVTVSMSATSGTVTYVGVTSNSLTITGTPITSSGTFTIDIPSTFGVTGNISAGNIAAGNITGAIVASTISANNVITSTVTTGTSPFSITSSTKVANLNVDYLNGINSKSFMYHPQWMFYGNQLSSGSAICFSTNGLHVLIGSSSSSVIYKYTLTIAWDLSTGSYSGQSYNVSAQTTGIRSIRWSADGTKFYTCSSTTDSVMQYNLSTAYNVTTATYATAISISSQEPECRGLEFKPDGFAFYIIGNTNKRVYQYTLSSAWDLSTATYSSISSPVVNTTTPQGLVFNPTGTKLFVLGQGRGGEIEHYNLTAWDITTIAYYDWFINFSYYETVPTDISVSSDGTQFYICGGSTYWNRAWAFKFSTPYDVGINSKYPIIASATETQNSVLVVRDNSGNINFTGATATGNILTTTGRIGTGYLYNDTSLTVGLPLSGFTSVWGVVSDGTIANNVTGNTYYYSSYSATANNTTLTNVMGFLASKGTWGTGTAITNQYGFFAASALTGATNNFGFFSNIASGANTYNFYAAGTAQNRFSGDVLIFGAGALGYTTGSGGTIPQSGSRTTGVTINKTNGAITLVSAAGSASWQTFTVTNSTVAATDTIIVNQKSGTDKYLIQVTAIGAGSFDITFATTGGTTTEQPVFNFAVIKAVTA